MTTYPTSPTYKLIEQLRVTEHVFQNTDSSEPVLLLVWNDCGGYVFNEDLQYYWLANMDMVDFFRETEGYDIFGESMISLIEERNVTFIISDEVDPSLFSEYYRSTIHYAISNNTRDYVLANYHPSDNPCLWVRDTNSSFNPLA